MEHIIIGTAGHIDHGKTALIKALTGHDTDTLKEEKKRGISIDLGFTYFDLPHIKKRAGIVDVPGHEKFLPNMLAGVTGMDLVLLVISLEEGIMPQTKEHIEILKQLKVKHIIIVFTKKDCVDQEWAQLIQTDTMEYFQNTCFENVPSIQVSAITGDGLDHLITLIEQEVNTIEDMFFVNQPLRLPIDRIFTVAGIGTIVTGTLLEGTIYKDQQIYIYPQNIQTKVRSLQVHGMDTNQAYSGQRVAVNLPGVKTEDLHRGSVITIEQQLQNTTILDVKLSISTETTRIIKNQMRLHLHIGTAELLCRAKLLDQDQLKAGESGYAQLLLEVPIAVKKQDCFVIRFYSPLETVGGGIVIDEKPYAKKRFLQSDLEYLQKKEQGDEYTLILREINKSIKFPLSSQEISKAIGLDLIHVNEILDTLISDHACVLIAGNKKNYYWSMNEIDIMCKKLNNLFDDFHKKHMYKVGIPKAVLHSELFKSFEIGRYDATLKYLEKNDFIKRIQDIIYSPNFHLIKDSFFEKTQKKILNKLNQSKYDFVNFNILMADSQSMDDVLDIRDQMLSENLILQLSDEYFITQELYIQTEKIVKEFFKTNDILTLSDVRNLLGTSRRCAQPLISLLDKKKVTAWCGKETERRSYK